MKRTIVTTPSADDDEEWDHQNAADVYYPDTQPGETEISFMLRRAFESHGYLVRDIREAPTHPVMIIHALRRSAPRISDPASFFRHVRGLLREAGFPLLRRDELTVSQTGNRILVGFQWQDSTTDYAAALRQADEDAAEFEGLDP